MIFWVLYSLAVLFCAGFFIWNLVRYVLPLRFKRKSQVRAATPSQVGLVAEIVALQAQFIVAPHLAIAEARKALEDRQAVAPFSSSSDEPAGEFEALVVALAQLPTSSELREV